MGNNIFTEQHLPLRFTPIQIKLTCYLLVYRYRKTILLPDLSLLNERFICFEFGLYPQLVARDNKTCPEDSTPMLCVYRKDNGSLLLPFGGALHCLDVWYFDQRFLGFWREINRMNTKLKRQ